MTTYTVLASSRTTAETLCGDGVTDSIDVKETEDVVAVKLLVWMFTFKVRGKNESLSPLQLR